MDGTMILASHRIAMICIGLLVIGYTFETVRRSRLLARYAILWMLTGTASLCCGLFPRIPIAIVQVFNVSSFIAAAGLVIFFFFVMVLFHLSTALSRMRSDENATARRCAILEAELLDLKEELARTRPRSAPYPPSNQDTESK